MKRLRRLFSIRNNKGYTLVEVIVATVLLGVLIIGIMLFMTPVFQNVDSNVEQARADTVATTMQNFINKTLKNAQYVKVYTGVSQASMLSITQSITGTLSAGDPGEDYKVMTETVQKHMSGGVKFRKLGCISLRYIEDKNPRNSDTGLNSYKYVLSNETIKLPGVTISGVTAGDYELVPSMSTPIFDTSFYENLYPTTKFERIQGHDLNKDGDNDPATLPQDVMYPGYKLTIDVYNEPGTIDATTSTIKYSDATKIFSGVGAIELNNIKSLEINPSGEFCTYENTNVGTGQDIYIFYIIREHVLPATPGP